MEYTQEIKTLTNSLKNQTLKAKLQKKWNDLVKDAKAETQSLSDSLRESRENKLTRGNRKRTRSEDNEFDNKHPRLDNQDAVLQSIGSLLQQLQKNGPQPRKPDHGNYQSGRNYHSHRQDRGKDPANRRNYPRKGHWNK